MDLEGKEVGLYFAGLLSKVEDVGDAWVVREAHNPVSLHECEILVVIDEKHVHRDIDCAVGQRALVSSLDALASPLAVLNLFNLGTRLERLRTFGVEFG